jgi:hypothetical protein
MASEAQVTVRSPFRHLMIGAMATLAALVVARFVLELAGMPHEVTRYISSTVGLLLVAIYVAAVGPLRGGLRKFPQLVLCAFLLAAWTEAWIILATLIAAALGLTRSHFAEHDIGNRGHLAGHLLGHGIETIVLFLVVLLLMSLVRLLWRWPVTVAPGALLGVFVIMRFWTEAMGLEPLRTSAWSSTLLLLLSALYLGGMGARTGLTEGRELLVPALVLGWTWRAWVYLATLFAAAVPAFKTHFFDPSQGHIAVRLLRALAGSVVEGFVVGMIVWGIAVWIACSIQPLGSHSAPPGAK